MLGSLMHRSKQQWLFLLSVLIVGTAVGYGSMSWTSSDPLAASDHETDHRIIAGIPGGDEDSVWVLDEWHDREPPEEGDQTALDLAPFPEPGPVNTTGTTIWHQSYKVSGQDIHAFAFDHAAPCTGIDLWLFTGENMELFLGTENYSHLTPAPGVLGNETILGDGWTQILLGTLPETQPMGCMFTGPHLHQSGRTATLFMQHNIPIIIQNPITPASDWAANWLHKVGPIAIDSDSDGWNDDTEAFITTDPFQPCGSGQFGFGAWPPDLDDNTVVSLADALMVFALNPSVEGDGTYQRRMDVNTNLSITLADALTVFALAAQSCAPSATSPSVPVAVGSTLIAAVSAAGGSGPPFPAGNLITVAVQVDGAQALRGAQLQFRYDPAGLRLVAIADAADGLFGSGGADLLQLGRHLDLPGPAAALVHDLTALPTSNGPIDTDGAFEIGVGIPDGEAVAGSGTLLTLTFRVIGPGSHEVTVESISGLGLLIDANLQDFNPGEVVTLN